MKKLSIIASIALLAGILHAQDSVKITFTAQLSDNSYIALDSVEIINRTKGWSETIYYPDTILQMVKSNVSVENVENQHFIISQNIPNPFDGTTNINMQLFENEDVELFLYDLNGKLCASSKQKMEHGTYKIAISVAVAQPYLLAIKTSKGTKTIKMLAQKGNGQFSIRSVYQGTSNFKKQKSTVEKSYESDDNLTYIGHCTYNGQQKGVSVFDTLNFNEKEITFIMPTSYKIGDIYYNQSGAVEGVVWWLADTAYMDDTIAYGLHGKICSLLETNLLWGPGPVSKNHQYFEIYAFDSLDGRINTDIIMHWRDTVRWDTTDYGDSNLYARVQAAPWCVSLGEGWYLPAIRELWEMLNVADSVLNPTLEMIPNAMKFMNFFVGFYWSSTAVCCPYNGETYTIYFAGGHDDDEYYPYLFLITNLEQQYQAWYTRAAKWF